MGMGVRVRRCVVWPLKGEGEISAGGPVRGMWPAVEAEGKERRRDEGAKKIMAAPAARGRSTQRAIQGPPSPTPKEMRPQFSPLQMQPQQGPSTMVYKSKPRPRASLPKPSKSYPTLPSPAISPTTPSYPAFPSPSHSAPPSSMPSHPSPFFSSPFTSNAMTTIAAQTGLGEDEPMPLSVKAWGKQKARSPSPGYPDAWIHSSGSRGGHSRRTSASHGPRDPMHSPIQDFSAFLNHPDPSPPRMHSSHQHVTPQGLHYHPIIPATSSPVPATSMDEPEQEPQPPDFYSLPFDTEPYGNGTIDPSLLGGGMMEPEVDMAYEPEVEAHEAGEHEMDNSFERDEQEEDVQMRSPSPSGYSSSSEEEGDAPLALRSSRSRPIRPHIPADMIPTTTVHSDGNSPSSDSAPPAPASPQLKPKPSPSPSRPKQTAVKRRVEKGGETKVDDSVIPSVQSADPFFRYSGPPWPPGDRTLFCHQCRGKRGYLSMKYERCGHIFCVRCIMMKYAPNTIAFDTNPDDDDCPRCNNTCTCDICTTRRGESYNYYKSSRRPQKKQKPLGPRVRRTLGEARPKQSPYHVLEQQVIEPTTYYATMYDMTGARIARTFLGVDGDNSVVVAQPARGPRVFIGAVAQEWRLGPNPVVHTELAPIRGKRIRGRGSGRFCVGDERMLSLRVRQRAPAPLQLPEPAAADLVPTVADPVPAVSIPDVTEPSIPAASPAAFVLVDATVPLVAPSSPSPPPAPVSADVEMNVLSDMELESDMGVDVPEDDFASSPLTSVTDSDQEDNGAGEGESETAGEDDRHGHGKGESGHWISLHAADDAALQKRPRTEGMADHCEAGSSSVTLTDSDVAKAISCALGQLGIPTVMATEPSVS
ncbi:hypothetical protein C8F04DRAFT_1088984 [Mycena alexandri]|uniref:RING-type domain-containing protein n=1 Tax=Mycena alexandri TaxID=1745969 RepID=A0AAD6T261_9AGAR|nr:hypothetical protein C8F04DRAFT_1099105 [Mycena alexandri]KAJ7038386.1 hypothetical protein C8F04DRAFT_1088984 [Mycena alexandri]